MSSGIIEQPTGLTHRQEANIYARSENNKFLTLSIKTSSPFDTTMLLLQQKSSSGQESRKECSFGDLNRFRSAVENAIMIK